MIGYFGIFNSIIDNVGSLIRSYPIVKDEIERMEILYIDEENNTGESVNNMSVIEATDISFSFDDKKIFNNISFSIEKGEKVAIVGANGSGKSTVLKLLCGLLKEYEGSIKINGKELNCISVDKWRDCFTFVTQDPYLFEGNVIENIGIGNSFADEAALDNVLERLGITYLADRDVLFNDKTLSGGEKQRISIARALLKGTDLIIFDEPSNNLDMNTIEWISKFIETCSETVIYISHDNDLIGKADKIIRL